VLGRSHPDARCELALLGEALAVIVTARNGRALLVLHFEHLAYLEPAAPPSAAHAYEVWDRAPPDGPRGLAFAVEHNQHGRAFVRLLEEAVRRQRPDLLGGHSSAEVEVEGRRLLEPPELWSGALRRPAPASQRRAVVLGEVYRRAHGKPEAQVRDLLEHELQQAGLTWWPESKDDLVRSVANQPPLLAGVLLRLVPGRRRRLEAHDRQAHLPPPQNPEMDALVDRLLALPGVSGVGWHSDDARAVDVRLDPWSEERAQQVRQLAAPRLVRFTT
jgi:hypothetical protein